MEEWMEDSMNEWLEEEVELGDYVADQCNDNCLGCLFFNDCPCCPF